MHEVYIFMWIPALLRIKFYYEKKLPFALHTQNDDIIEILCENFPLVQMVEASLMPM